MGNRTKFKVKHFRDNAVNAVVLVNHPSGGEPAFEIVLQKATGLREIPLVSSTFAPEDVLGLQFVLREVGRFVCANKPASCAPSDVVTEPGGVERAL